MTGPADHVELFGEAPTRVLLSVPPAAVAAVREAVDGAGLEVVELGDAGGDRLVVGELVDVTVADLDAAGRDVLPGALGA
ncbi:hypothetical protein GHK86_13705 [Acidimicrobiaceae bacterium USS-CC1]|uniref:Uncharacterized protein n=1 Tax=Acidiferrimicrobium australe TaxID=2664430 RepID=A0ABW9QV69_9ACTN|nr:hypothetical protein [Acidiferrimicrobium australe]